MRRKDYEDFRQHEREFREGMSDEGFLEVE